MLMNLFRYFDAALRDSVNTSGRSMVIAASVGAAVFAGYGILWLYVTPLEHESLGLRAIAVLLCLAVSLSRQWPQRLRPFLPWVWFTGVMYTLPFYATYQLLGSNYSVLRSMLEVTMVFFVIIIFPHYMLALVNMAVGIGLGAAAGYLTIPEFGALNHAIVKSVHIQAMVYSVAAGLLFTRSNLKGILARQRIDTLKDLAGSLAHELRNPLGQLRYRLESIGQNLPRPTADGCDLSMRARALDAVYKELAEGKIAIERGLQMISMTLDEIHAKPLDTSNLRYLSAETATRKAVDEFGYESGSDRTRVELQVLQEFVFKGDETRYIFVLFNLLKNALHYFKDHPAARIRITVGGHCVTFEDTGPGMKPEVLARVFESFHTSGKAGGTGLGLSFCKRTMVAFGGDISCESELGQFTRFVLRFPAVPPSELAAHEAQVLQQARLVFSGKRVLVVDDVAVLRKTARSMLEPLGVEVAEAENGQQALEMLSSRTYSALVLDLSMPILDGYATAEHIRAGHIHGIARLPIVAYTAESAQVARAKLERVAVDALVHKPCSQLDLIEALCWAHEHAGRGESTSLAADSLAGRTILLADDEAFNRRYLRALLEQGAVKVVEASDGASAFQMLETLAVDAIITDIHMPVLDGIGLAQAVHASTLPRKPVLIALSARDDAAILEKARAAGISDFVLKPADAGELFDKLARHLGSHDCPARAPATRKAHATDLAEPELLDLNRVESVRRMRMDEHALAEAVQTSRTLLDKLQGPIERQDIDASIHLLHTLIGLWGTMGSHALRQKVRAMHGQLVEHGQWPETGWHEELLQLHEQTAHAMAGSAD